jgi:hypothetical protein
MRRSMTAFASFITIHGQIERISNILFVEFRTPCPLSYVLITLRIGGFGGKLMQERGPTDRTPRWVKVIGIMALALLPVFVGLHVVGASLLGHALGGHGNHAPPSGAAEPGMQQP